MAGYSITLMGGPADGQVVEVSESIYRHGFLKVPMATGDIEEDEEYPTTIHMIAVYRMTPYWGRWAHVGDEAYGT